MSETAQVNGPSGSGKFIDGIDDVGKKESKPDPDDPAYIKNLQRPAEVKEDIHQMENRSRVKVVLNSETFKEELEEIVDEQIRNGPYPASLLALQQINELLTPSSRGGLNNLAKASTIIPINDLKGADQAGFSKGEKLLRCKLAAVYRLVDLHGWSEGIYNHISARVSPDNELFLLNPFGITYPEVTASSLVKVDVNGDIVDSGTSLFGISKAGFTLHSTIHQARPDIKCIIHLHTPAGIAVSSMKCGLLPLCQEAMFCGNVSYHDYQGVLVDQEEREKIARNLGVHNKVLILRNHGVVACGETVEEAFYNVNNLMVACEAQVQAIPAGLDNLHLPSEEVRQRVFKIGTQGAGGVESQGKKWRTGEMEFEALMRSLDNSGYRTGYMYKVPMIKQEKKDRTNSEVEIPPSSSSFTYVFDGDYENSKYVSPLKMAQDRQKKAFKAGWLTSPNAYKKTELEEIGTTTPKKITRWVSEGGESPNKPGCVQVKLEHPNQFAPQGENPKEFKQKQKSIKKDYYEERVSAGPQSKILEGMSWDEAQKAKDGQLSGAADQVIVVGAASKGIIQRDHQHNAVVYRQYYAANPFENMSEAEIENYQGEVQNKESSQPDEPVQPQNEVEEDSNKRQEAQDTEEISPKAELNYEPSPTNNGRGFDKKGQEAVLARLANTVVQTVMHEALAVARRRGGKGQQILTGSTVDSAAQPQCAESLFATGGQMDKNQKLGDKNHLGRDNPQTQYFNNNNTKQFQAESRRNRVSGDKDLGFSKRRCFTSSDDAHTSIHIDEEASRGDSVTLQIDPIMVQHSCQANGMKIKFSVHSTVRRRVTAEIGQVSPIEEIVATATQPTVHLLQSDKRSNVREASGEGGITAMGINKLHSDSSKAVETNEGEHTKELYIPMPCHVAEEKQETDGKIKEDEQKGRQKKEKVEEDVGTRRKPKEKDKPVIPKIELSSPCGQEKLSENIAHKSVDAKQNEKDSEEMPIEIEVIQDIESDKALPVESKIKDTNETTKKILDPVKPQNRPTQLNPGYKKRSKNTKQNKNKSAKKILAPLSPVREIAYEGTEEEMGEVGDLLMSVDDSFERLLLTAEDDLLLCDKGGDDCLDLNEFKGIAPLADDELIPIVMPTSSEQTAPLLHQERSNIDNKPGKTFVSDKLNHSLSTNKGLVTSEDINLKDVINIGSENKMETNFDNILPQNRSKTKVNLNTETNVVDIILPKTETKVCNIPPKTETNVYSIPQKTDTKIDITSPKTETNVYSIPPKTETNVYSIPPKTKTNIDIIPSKAETNVDDIITPKTETNVYSIPQKTETNMYNIPSKNETNVDDIILSKTEPNMYNIPLKNETNVDDIIPSKTETTMYNIPSKNETNVDDIIPSKTETNVDDILPSKAETNVDDIITPKTETNVYSIPPKKETNMYNIPPKNETNVDDIIPAKTETNVDDIIPAKTETNVDDIPAKTKTNVDDIISTKTETNVDYIIPSKTETNVDDIIPSKTEINVDDIILVKTETNVDDIIPSKTETNVDDIIPSKTEINVDDIILVKTETNVDDIIPSKTETNVDDIIPSKTETDVDDIITAKTETNVDDIPAKTETNVDDIIPRTETNVDDIIPSKTETNIDNIIPANIETNVDDLIPANLETNIDIIPVKTETNIDDVIPTKTEINFDDNSLEKAEIWRNDGNEFEKRHICVHSVKLYNKSEIDFDEIIQYKSTETNVDDISTNEIETDIDAVISSRNADTNIQEYYYHKGETNVDYIQYQESEGDNEEQFHNQKIESELSDFPSEIRKGNISNVPIEEKIEIKVMPCTESKNISVAVDEGSPFKSHYAKKGLKHMLDDSVCSEGPLQTSSPKIGRVKQKALYKDIHEDSYSKSQPLLADVDFPSKDESYLTRSSSFDPDHVPDLQMTNLVKDSRIESSDEEVWNQREPLSPVYNSSRSILDEYHLKKHNELMELPSAKSFLTSPKPPLHGSSSDIMPPLPVTEDVPSISDIEDADLPAGVRRHGSQRYNRPSHTMQMKLAAPVHAESVPKKEAPAKGKWVPKSKRVKSTPSVDTLAHIKTDQISSTIPTSVYRYADKDKDPSKDKEKMYYKEQGEMHASSQKEPKIEPNTATQNKNELPNSSFENVKRKPSVEQKCSVMANKGKSKGRKKSHEYYSDDTDDDMKHGKGNGYDQKYSNSKRNKEKDNRKSSIHEKGGSNKDRKEEQRLKDGVEEDDVKNKRSRDDERVLDNSDEDKRRIKDKDRQRKNPHSYRRNDRRQSDDTNNERSKFDEEENQNGEKEKERRKRTEKSWRDKRDRDRKRREDGSSDDDDIENHRKGEERRRRKEKEKGRDKGDNRYDDHRSKRGNDDKHRERRPKMDKTNDEKRSKRFDDSESDKSDYKEKEQRDKYKRNKEKRKESLDKEKVKNLDDKIPDVNSSKENRWQPTEAQKPVERTRKIGRVSEGSFIPDAVKQQSVDDSVKMNRGLSAPNLIGNKASPASNPNLNVPSGNFDPGASPRLSRRRGGAIAPDRETLKKMNNPYRNKKDNLSVPSSALGNHLNRSLRSVHKSSASIASSTLSRRSKSSSRMYENCPELLPPVPQVDPLTGEPYNFYHPLMAKSMESMAKSMESLLSSRASSRHRYRSPEADMTYGSRGTDPPAENSFENEIDNKSDDKEKDKSKDRKVKEQGDSFEVTRDESSFEETHKKRNDDKRKTEKYKDRIDNDDGDDDKLGHKKRYNDKKTKKYKDKIYDSDDDKRRHSKGDDSKGNERNQYNQKGRKDKRDLEKSPRNYSDKEDEPRGEISSDTKKSPKLISQSEKSDERMGKKTVSISESVPVALSDNLKEPKSENPIEPNSDSETGEKGPELPPKKSLFSRLSCVGGKSAAIGQKKNEDRSKEPLEKRATVDDSGNQKDYYVAEKKRMKKLAQEKKLEPTSGLYFQEDDTKIDTNDIGEVSEEEETISKKEKGLVASKPFTTFATPSKNTEGYGEYFEDESGPINTNKQALSKKSTREPVKPPKLSLKSSNLDDERDNARNVKQDKDRSTERKQKLQEKDENISDKKWEPRARRDKESSLRSRPSKSPENPNPPQYRKDSVDHRDPVLAETFNSTLESDLGIFNTSAPTHLESSQSPNITDTSYYPMDPSTSFDASELTRYKKNVRRESVDMDRSFPTGGYSPPLKRGESSPVRRRMSQVSLGGMESSGLSRTRSSSTTSNPLTYQPWRSQRRRSRSMSISEMAYAAGATRPNRSHSVGEITYTTLLTQPTPGRRRSRTNSIGEIAITSRMYHRRRSRSHSRASLGDTSFGSVAPGLQRRQSGTWSSSHPAELDVVPANAAPVRRSESAKEPSKNSQLIDELGRKNMERTKSDRQPQIKEELGEEKEKAVVSPSKSDTMKSTDSASVGETLEERSSKEGSPTKEHPATKDKKGKKKKFRIPSFSKKKNKEHKESAI